jgi:hypothetical protein
MTVETRLSLADALERLASAIQQTPAITVGPLVGELRQAATMLQTQEALKSWVCGLLERAGKIGSATLEATVTAAATAASKHYAVS